MPLTALKVRQAKPKDRPYKLFDERGLFLLVNPNGSKLWRFKYHYCQKEKQLSFGPYTDVSLAQAREARADARRQLVEGTDPSTARKARKAAVEVGVTTFEMVAREWLADMSLKWARSHYTKVARRLEREIFPSIGHLPIADIGPRDLLSPLRAIVDRGNRETARRVKQICGQVFRYAVATGLADRDITPDLIGALPPPVTRHHPSITDRGEIGGLLRAIDGYSGSPITKLALQLAPLVFVRPGELRGAEWSEVSIDLAEWRIKAERMKMRTAHIVPLSNQATQLLKELRMLSGKSRYLLPSIRTIDRCMSENTLNAALRRLGYASGEMTAHGFRSMASTLLNESGWNRDAIERQLAHAERDSIRAAYNYAEHLPLRREMMQAWADYLDKLRFYRPAAAQISAVPVKFANELLVEPLPLGDSYSFDKL